MRTRQHIPDDLARRAPGAELAGVLAWVELSRLAGFDAVAVLRAEYRQLAHAQARVLAAMAEVGQCDDPDSLSRCVPGQFAAEEARAALTLTRRRADDEFWFAQDLLTRLPAVHAAMLAGDCDRPRAWLFADWTTDLAPEQARAIVERLLPRVARGELTTGQLIEQLKKRAIAVDPDWARRRYARAVADRKVIGSRNPDGTANLGGYNLPIDRVATAAAHLDALAKAAKHAGSRRRLDHLRAELFLGMTDGAYTGLDDPAIIALLLAGTDDDDDPDDPDDPAGTAAAESAAPAPTEPAAPEPSPAEPAAPAPTEPGAPEPSPADSAAPAPTEPGAPEPSPAEPAAPAAAAPAAPEPGPAGPDDPAGAAAGAASGRGAGGIELRARVSTLLGHDRHPGELAGWGPIGPDLTADLARRLSRGHWRWVITDPHGLLLDCGTSRARPTGWPTGPRTRDVVELQIPETLLTAALHAGELGPWAPVLADLARQHALHDPDEGRFAGDTHRRHPGAAQRRWLQMRDRHCLGTGCRAPARGNQQDHTIDHAYGGPTLDWNLGGLCGRDHALKTDGGWHLTQHQPGHFRWRSRLGHTYQVPPRPVIEPLPAPLPRDPDPDPRRPAPEQDWEHDKILEDPPPEPEPPPVQWNDPDEPPPF